ncbi:MAG TPA: hypothetical protein VGF59_13080 [Bryobacteraceae bacterium]|jgi:outer membrane lipoprotein-sorting protein
MDFRRVPALLLLLCLMSLTLSSCLAVRRTIVRPGGAAVTQKLLVANKAVLIDAIARYYNSIHDFSATVDMVPALGTAEKSKITEYKDIRGFILFRKPASIRIIGLYPVVRNKAFDMVSGGTTFKLYTPSRNLFITGTNEIEQPSPNKIENLRPQHFVDAILVRPVDDGEKVLMENYTDEENAFYILHIIHEAGPGDLQLERTVWFSRIDLQISRQLIFDAAGNILTDARFTQWHAYDNVAFPKHVEINRPRDEYAVVIDVVKMDINKGVTDDKFVLDQPPGTTLKMIGSPAKGPTQ